MLKLTILLLLLKASHLFGMTSLTTTSNVTETLLNCHAAEDFIRTHMAPDFETPRLVRRLDWFFDDTLVASYQQDVLADSTRQWWVTDGRYHLLKPFYTLRLAPVTAEDSGVYRCRIETDPLFSAEQDTEEMELTVMVKPVPPSTPEVKEYTNRSITLLWNHSAARAHKPILRFSISVRTITDGTRFVMAAPSNSTTVIVENLDPFTLYALSVRAENAAGNSEFGPEVNIRTRGDAPRYPPKIVSIKNISSKCVEMVIEPPYELQGDLSSYIVLAQLANGTSSRRVVYDNPTSTPLTLCDLLHSSAYSLTIEADNGFGRSPFATATFYTEPDVPNLSPDTVTAISIVGKPEVTVLWNAPGNPSTPILKYHLYYKTILESEWKVEHLSVGKVRPKMYRFRLIGLDPNTTYQMRVSASTSKGEGEKSGISVAKTDVSTPSKINLRSLTFDCKNGITVIWDHPDRKMHPTFTTKLTNASTTLTFNTTKTRLDIIDLALQEEYLLQIQVVVPSVVDNLTQIVGDWSEVHRFYLGDNCQLQSSICSGQEKCMKLVMQTAVGNNHVSIAVIILAVLLFLFICVIIAHLAKGTANLKRMLKKKKEKCVYLDEISPLVYDSTGFEEIPVELFYGYVEDLKKYDNTKFRSQFEKVEQTTTYESEDQPDGTESEHSEKNRYMNIGSIEATRIRLDSASGNDYINANFIDSCNEKNAYIATQAPLPSTFNDFWQMTWQENSNIIVCITNMIEDGKRKCDQYWPEKLDYAHTYGNHTVKMISEVTNAYFIHRIFTIKISKAIPVVERKIHHLHFTGWPDHGVPTSVFPLLNFIHYTSDIHSTGPVIVHCSAGVGRSGSYMLVDSVRRHLISHRKLNVLGHLVHMRKQREKLVQTLDQYIFCHEAIRQLIRHGITRVHTDLFMRYMNYLSEENVQGKTRLQIQYEEVCRCLHEPRCQISSEFMVLPGYHRLNEYIVGVWPTETEDLWRLVWKQNVQNILMIVDQKTDTFWNNLNKVDTVSIQHTENMVLLQSTDTQMCVRIITVTKADIHHDFWREIENIQKQRLASHDAPLLVLCPSQPIGISSHGIPTAIDSDSSTLSMSMLGQPNPSDETSLAVIVCALTTLACQLESTGCVDVVQVLSGYSQVQCGVFTSKQDVEIIYEKISQLVGGTRV